MDPENHEGRNPNPWIDAAEQGDVLDLTDTGQHACHGRFTGPGVGVRCADAYGVVGAVQVGGFVAVDRVCCGRPGVAAVR